jgi:hypothetical protein
MPRFWQAFIPSLGFTPILLQHGLASVLSVSQSPDLFCCHEIEMQGLSLLKVEFYVLHAFLALDEHLSMHPALRTQTIS